MITPELKEALQTGLGEAYRLGDLAFESFASTVFHAQSSNSDSVAVILETAAMEAVDFNRFLEASFLNHPNLVRVLKVGWIESENARLAYLVTESVQGFLSETSVTKTLALAELLDVAEEVAGGLSSLHAENLVYCALHADTVWRVGDRWKLADFGQLRVPGSDKADSLRPLFVHSKLAAPPEAFFGEVTPAWDVWSLGNLLGRIQRPLPKRGAAPDLKPAPPVCVEFDELIADMSAPEPSARPTFQQLLPRFHEMKRKLESGELVEGAEQPKEAAAVVPPPTSAAQAAAPPRYIPIAAPRTLIGIPRQEALSKESRTLPWARVIQAVVLIAGILIVAILFAGKAAKTPLMQPPPSAAEPASKPEGADAHSPAQPIAGEKADATQEAIPEAALPTRNTSLSTPEKKARIVSVLDRWASAVRARSAAGQLSCYGPVVDTYFGRHHVTSPELQSEKNRVFSQIGPVERFDIGAVRYDRLGDDWAVVSFDKTWAFAGRKPFSGSAREQVVMRSFGGEWKITSERELKVYSIRMAG